MTGRPLLGAHESVAGGLHLAFERASADGAEAIQIFTKNARGWAGKPLAPEDAARFRAAARAARVPAVSHASYLVNLASEDPGIRGKSLDAMADEVARCDALSVPLLVVHPGSHPDPARGAALAGQALREVRRRAPRSRTRILIENAAGQGHSLGRTFEELAAILRAAGSPAWLGVCLDSCHLFAAGHDIRTPRAYARTLAAFDAAVGLSRVRAWHLNDSKGPLGCRVDRHENVGDGQIGLAAFACIVNDARFASVPAVLETEEGSQKENLRRLRALRRPEAREERRRELA